MFAPNCGKTLGPSRHFVIPGRQKGQQVIADAICIHFSDRMS